MQHFGPSRYAAKEKLNRAFEVVDYKISFSGLAECEKPILEAIKFFNQPASPEFIAAKLARLRAVMARTAESQDDLAITLDTYSEFLAEYPPDAVAQVVNQFIRTKKWFPTVSELVADLDAVVSFRRRLLDAFQRPSARGLPKNETKAITGDPRGFFDYRAEPRERWSEGHYQAWVDDAKAMAERKDLAEMGLSAESWKAELDRRVAEFAAWKNERA